MRFLWSSKEGPVHHDTQGARQEVSLPPTPAAAAFLAAHKHCTEQTRAGISTNTMSCPSPPVPGKTATSQTTDDKFLSPAQMPSQNMPPKSHWQHSWAPHGATPLNHYMPVHIQGTVSVASFENMLHLSVMHQECLIVMVWLP